MSERKLWMTAAVGDLTVAIISFAVFGVNTVGAGSATRNTARFAMCFLLVGFARPGLRRWFPALPPAWWLIRAYMAAQFVHFAFVAALHTAFVSGTVHLRISQYPVALLGFSLVALTGYTAKAEGRGHTILLYINWLILAVNYSKHPVTMMRLAAIPVFLALLLRWLPSGRPEAMEVAAG